MRLTYLASITALVLVGELASAANVKRQSGPVDPSTDPDCSYYDTSYSQSDNCAYFESFWGISHANFVAWNPSVKDDCSGIKVGNSYCVEVTRKPTTTTSSTASSPVPTGPPKPSPTQVGLIESCTTFYFAVDDDTCDSIVEAYGTFTKEEFIAWNPAVQADCIRLWAKTYYCVGIPGTPTAPPSSTTTVAPTGAPKPSPTQAGLIESCINFYFAAQDDTCDSIVEKFGTFTYAQFVEWNPAVGDDCRKLWADTYYCVGLPGNPTTTIKPPITTTTTTTTSAPGNGVATPTPTQPGMVSNCDAFYFVKQDEGCQAIADANGITMAQFTAWNPGVGGAACKGLWSQVYVCVSIIGHTPTTSKPTTTTTTTTTASPTDCQTAHPTPTQPGSVCRCSKWYLPATDEYCDDVMKKFGISAAQFQTWNPQVGDGCKGLWKGYYVCVKA